MMFIFSNKVWILQEVAKILDDTWAVINDMPDAIKLYGKNPVAGKGYNSDFRKVLSRKFNEVISFYAVHLCQGLQGMTTA